MIDLHLHTTASDGTLSPEALVSAAAAAGLTTLAVTDHDTTAGLAAVSAAAAARGMTWIPGIEITAIHTQKDVHMLAYCFDVHSAELAGFLETQRTDRKRRLFEMAALLEGLGVPVDIAPIEEAAAMSGRAPGRPLLAAALVRAGHVPDIAVAFDRFLGTGRPAFVPRKGASPAEVVSIVARAGGVTSMAHPGKMGLDEIIAPLAEAGMPAIEVHHTDHSADDVARYAQMAADLGLLVTGGSDYHGPSSGRRSGLGRVTLPPADFTRLVEFAGWH